MAAAATASPLVQQHTMATNGFTSIGVSAPATSSSPPGHGAIRTSGTPAGKPTLIQWGKLRFLVMDSPRENNLHLYLKECKLHNVTDVVRVCEECYSAAEVEAAGIRMHEIRYEDGASPPREVIDRWLTLVDEVFFKHKSPPDAPTPAIAVHCVAGLGRAPVLVALALIEYGFGEPLAVVEFIRSQRRGAINTRQLNYLEQYQKRGAGSVQCACTIM